MEGRPASQTDPLPLFLNLLSSAVFATRLDPVRVVNEAVQDGVRQSAITNQFMPSFVLYPAGDQRGITT